MYDIFVKKIINLRFMHFPDNKIDYKFSGRPYLIYNIDNNFVYLLKLSGKKSDKGEQYYYEILPDNINKLNKKSYIDLKYFLIFEIEELESIVVTQQMEYNLKEYGAINSEQLEEILNKMKSLYVNNLNFV